MRWHAPAGLLVLLALGTTGLAQPAEPAPPPRKATAARLANAVEVRKHLGLSPAYDNLPGVEALKVAVLDYGFDGAGSKPYLPDNTVIVEHYDPELVRRNHLGDPEYRKDFERGNRHGRTMAQIVWAVTGFRPGGPQFYLLNANGPTMLRRAIRYAIEQKVDLILFSGSFEGGGNGDGRGPINRAVADALAAGILWVNAAGNYGHCVYSGPVRIGDGDYLRFRDGADGTVLRFRNRVDENTVTVTLTWNDYREQEDAGTDKDLDLYVEDPAGRLIGSSTKTQVPGDREPGADETRNPRERVVLTDLPANLDFNYRIRVRARSHNFTWDDRVRVLVTSSRESYVDPATNTPDEAVKFFDATGKQELYPPADNPLVLTVGDSSPVSSVGPTADHRVKPDVILEDSRAFFSDGEVSSGSSNAAAYFAGVVALLKAAEPGLQTRHLLGLARPDAPAATLRTAGAGAVERLPPPQLITTPGPPAPSPSRVLVLVGPRGRTRILTVPSLPSPGGMVPTPAPSSRPAPASETRTTAAGRVWRTPSRTRLAEVVRSER
jgi:hypothetical protein